ncbi:radical SAM protein [Dehalococcoidia bacterium]|nr:radical SAM protein [Dehalococcoidia bacterium]
MKKRFFIKEGLKQWYLPLSVTLAKYINEFFPLIPFRPAAGNIMVTHNCNSRCLMCSFWENRSTGELNTTEIGNILGQTREIGIRRICFSGGEPLLREDLPLLVKKAHDLKFENIQVLTNGLLWNEHKARDLLEKGLNRVSLSIDGLGEAHDTQRGIKGAYKKAIDTLEMLCNLRDKEFHNLEIEVATTLTVITMSSICELLKICKEFKVSCTLQILENTSFWSRNLDISPLTIKDKEEIDELIDELHYMKRKGYPISIIVSHIALEYMRHYLKGENPPRFFPDAPCAAGFTAIYVNAHGKVFPGCWAIPPVGDLRERELKEIVYTLGYRETLKQMFLKHCPTCPNGYIWSEWYYMPAYFKEVLLHLRFLSPSSRIFDQKG